MVMFLLLVTTKLQCNTIAMQCTHLTQIILHFCISGCFLSNVYHGNVVKSVY